MARTLGERLIRKEKWSLCVLAASSLGLHLAGVAAIGNRLVADEIWYVPEANSLLHGGPPTDYVHPFLGKLFIMAGVAGLGDNPWGWRTASVVFATISVVIFYFICRRLAGKRTAFFASFILVFENFTFLYCGVAMLDVFSYTFMLLSFVLYLDKRYAACGAAIALAALCKSTGFLAGVVILAYWWFTWFTTRSPRFRGIGLLVASAAVTYIVLMPFVDFAATGEWLNPFRRAIEVTIGYGGNEPSELGPGALAVVRYPWDFVLSPGGNVVNPKLETKAILTPTVWLLLAPSMVYMAYQYVKRRRDIAIFALLWFGVTYLIWIPYSVLSAPYVHYYLPAVPAVCMALGFGIQRVWSRSAVNGVSLPGWLTKGAVVVFLLVHVLLFLALSPLAEPAA
ncbi:MAG: hypothetical protein DRI39_01665 [Chloroflexi bacterium]|nr:MAG: hypothetical protein DRI39_01665 [Chloroflexota bacterium]